MLLKEMMQPKLLQSRDEIAKWLNDHYIKEFAINDDLSVDVVGRVRFIYGFKDQVSEIPINFRYVEGDFTMYGQNVTSLGPWCPDYCYSFECYNNEFKSFHNIHKYIKRTHFINIDQNATNLLGIFYIQDLEHIVVDDDDEQIGPITEILNKYLPTKDVHSAQEELLELGFTQQARF